MNGARQAEPSSSTKSLRMRKPIKVNSLTSSSSQTASWGKFAMSLKQEEPSMKRFPLLFLGLAVALASAAFPVFGADLPTLPAKGISEIDTLLQEAVRQGTVPGVVAIVTNKDRVLYHGAFGVMDTGKRKPMQKDSIFRIASMTKPVTSIAIMMLKEQGKLGLDDPVSKYLPAFQNREVISSFNPADAPWSLRTPPTPYPRQRPAGLSQSNSAKKES